MMIRWPWFVLLLTLLAAPLGPARSMPDEWSCGTEFPEFGETSSNMLRARPNLDTYVDSEDYPLRVHYNLEDEDLMWIVLDSAVLSYEIEVLEWGWYPPVSDDGNGGSDDLDFYITDTDPGIGGYMTIDHWNDCYAIAGRSVCPAYMVINREMPDYFTAEVVAHEFNHALQYSMDAVEDPQMKEGTATYSEGPVHSYSTAWGMAVDYQSQWYEPLDFFGYGTGYQYGTFIFLQYLAERYGDGTPQATRELWDYSTQTNFGNSKDWMSGLEDWLEDNWADDLGEPGDGESHVQLAWRDWSEWRFFLGPYADDDHITEGEPATGSARLPFAETFYYNELASGPVTKVLPKEMGELSTAAFELEPIPADIPVDVVFEADGGDEFWALTIVQMTTEKEVLEVVVGPIEGGGAVLSTTTLEDTHQVVVLLAGLGDLYYTPNTDDWQHYGGAITVTTEGFELPADTPQDDDDDGCGCRLEGSPAAAPLAGMTLLGLLLASRRR